MRMEEDTGGVLTVLQQGSPPRQRLARSRDALALKARTPDAKKTPQMLSLAYLPFIYRVSCSLRVMFEVKALLIGCA